jgi:two-component system CheB/CheR fusion protein
VACLGASAGGLEALEKFFAQVPANSGLAFVVVQHLSPDFKSLMGELLSRHTQMKIHPVEEGMAIEPNSIYLIPPKKEMIVSGGKLHLTDKDRSQGLSLPIDTFMRSLAQDYGERAIGVILSGTGSDGSRGIRAIHEAGGLVIVQDEESANFDGMPRSAIDTGIVDAVLPPHRMAEAILQHVRGEWVRGSAKTEPSISEAGIAELFSALREAYGIDFSYYKPNTVARRVERRLQMFGASDLNDYVQFVLSDTEELNSLYRDLLIGVTKFFRDGEAFRQLQLTVIPEILNRVRSEDELRLWVTGCATGEEAYSLAILVHQALTERSRPIHAKIFATDVHRASLDFASTGIYSADSLSEVSPERLKRYFVKSGSGYQVTPDLRRMVVFAPHNVVRDAPFTKLDLISCRNLLIYLQPDAQKKVLSLFHFGLRASGFLFLGPSESPGDLADEYETVDRHWKLYRKRRDIRLPANMRLPLSPGLERLRASAQSIHPPRGIPEIHLLRTYDALLEEYVPPSLLVDEHRKLVHSFAGAGKLLAMPDGRPSEDILDYVDPDLKLALAGALQRAASQKQPIVYGSVRSRSLPEDQQLRLSVRPISIQSTGDDYYLITFETQQKKTPTRSTADEIDFGEASRDRLNDVEEELRYTKENLQATVEEMETTNEELQATNEELVASNEELQSTNEELHSVNEELYMVNAEHQRKITELTELTDDMDNLLRSTEIGTIFLDHDLNIRKFTPQISRAFQILAQDVGRPLDAFSHNIHHKTLLEDVRRVLETGEPFEQDVQNRHGQWFLLRIFPYRAKEHVEGVVVTLIDIDTLKRSEEKLRRMSKVFQDGADPIIIEDLQGKIVELNAEAERVYGWSRDELIGGSITLLVPEDQADAAMELRRKCRDSESLRNVETLRCDRSGATHPVLLTLSLLTNEDGSPAGIATIAKNISARKAAEEEARQAVRRRDEFLAMLSHELRNPLSAVCNASKILELAGPTPTHAEASEVIRRQAGQMARLLDDLLDVSRVTQGKIDIHKEVIDLRELSSDAVEGVQAEIDQRRHTLRVKVAHDPVYVEGDPSRLLQIQQNLLVNAAKYTPDNGQISLSIFADGSHAVISVKDNGQGIAADLLGAVFDLFVQGDKPLDRSEGGMGVGLSLVKMLVELHGGSVTAHSAGPNCGSEFIVRLPLTTKSPSETASVPGHPLQAGSRVLVVEDNDDSRLMLEQLLRLDGHQVAVAADGPSGYEAIANGAADVALVDIGLPLMNGYELARRVRTELPSRSVRLVALTGYGRKEDQQAALDAGFDEHLVKPVSPDELARVLRRPR